MFIVQFFKKFFIFTCVIVGLTQASFGQKPKLIYLASDLRIPFWSIMDRGVQRQATALGYEIVSYSANNDAKSELEFTAKAIKEGAAGIIVSPTNSSACVTILKLAKNAGVPVVISDIGTESGDYVSYISSDNYEGAYQIGKVLTRKLHALKWNDGRVGIISIPQKRENGKARTAGFMKALDEAGIKAADLKQQVNFSYQETYNFSKELIANNHDLRAIWLQGSDRYQGALDAIEHSGKKGQILLICFDAEPEFLEMIPAGILVGAAMQQPFLMGEEAINAMHKHLKGEKVEHTLRLPILPVSTESIEKQLPVIKRNVLGILD